MRHFGKCSPLPHSRPRPWRWRNPASAESKFACEPGETYVMNVMVSAHPYWVPVYEGFKQAAEAMGCEDGVLGHARLRHHQADRLVRAGPGQEAGGHPAAPDAVRPVHRADQPRHRQRHRGRDLRGGFAEVEAHRLHHLRQPRRGQVRGRGDRQAGRRQAANTRCSRTPARATTTCGSRRSSPTWRSNYPDMKLVGRQATNQDSNAAYQATARMLQANPDLGAHLDPRGRLGRRRRRGRARGQGRRC